MGIEQSACFALWATSYLLAIDGNVIKYIGVLQDTAHATTTSQPTNRAPNDKTYICPRKHILGHKLPFLGQTFYRVFFYWSALYDGIYYVI